MDAGASIIAVVTIGLQSVKVVYGVISAIKDGPSKLGDLRGAIWSLQSLLEQMQHNSGLTISPTTTSSPLLPLVERCVEDIKRFEAKVGKLYIPEKEKLSGRFWKRLKLAFGEKQIPYMISVVTGHLNALSLHCNVRMINIMNDMSMQQRGIGQTVTEVARDVAAISSSAAQVDMVAGQIKIHQTLDTMAPSVAAISTLSTAQAEIACGLTELKQLYQQMTTTLAHSVQQNGNTELKGSTDLANDWSTILSSQLNQLFEMFGEEQRTIPASDAEDMIELIETLLGLVRKDFLATSFAHHPIQSSDVKILGRELKQLAANFTTAQFIGVNLAKVEDSIPITGLISSHKRTETTVYGTNGSLTVRRIASRKAQSGSQEREMSNKKCPHWESNTTTVSILFPSEDSSGNLLKASVRQATSPQWRGLFTFAPTISVYRTVSSDSEVFECIRTGRLDDFIRLLSNGKASLRDRDEFGASLLHYACFAVRPDMCAFLIDHGADIDDEALDGHVINLGGANAGWHRTPLTSLPLPPSPLHAEHRREEELKCFNLLLGRGADPLLGMAAQSVFLMGDQQYANALLKFGKPFIDINVRLDRGNTFLHISSSDLNCQNIMVLIDNGIEIDAVNDDGMTSLQLLLLCLDRVPRWDEGLASVNYFIEHGANIYAIWDGKSCSAIAYENKRMGSYAGDIWDAALAATGHSVQYFRQGYPHRACYYDEYTMETFKTLWKGTEEQCPYYAEATSFYTDIKYEGGYRISGIYSKTVMGWESDASDLETDESDSDGGETDESDPASWETESESET